MHNHTALALLRVILVCGCCAFFCIAPHIAHGSQQQAMHVDRLGDLSLDVTAPHYVINGTVEPRTRSAVLWQTLQWHNTTGAFVTELPFRLYANLPDFAGHTLLHAATVNGQAVRYVHTHRNTIVTLFPLKMIAPGERVDVTMHYTTTVPENQGHVAYGAFNDDGTTLSFASAYPLLVEYQSGRWVTDIPDTKGDMVNSPMATYAVTLTLPVTHRLVSTGSTLGITRHNETHTYSVASGLQRDFMFAITSQPVMSTQVDGTRINLYAGTAPEIERTLALTAAAQALRLFNTRYGRYPYAELDLITVDAGSFYGVEYPGIILLQTALLRSTPRRITSIVVHEVAHQWFYNLVGNDVQREAWVDEAMASYAQVVYWRAYGGEAAAAAELADFQRQYDRIVERGGDGPVAQDMRAYTLYSFNVLAYAKGALFYDAVSQQIGKETFDRALRAYVQHYQYQIADGSSFARIANDICACSIDPLVETWIHMPVKESTP